MSAQEIEERFRRNLIEIIRKRGLSEAEVSLAAGLNRRFVTDLREGKARAPKLPNAYRLAEALDMDLRDIIAGYDRPKINVELISRLEGYSPDEQARILAALEALLPRQE